MKVVFYWCLTVILLNAFFEMFILILQLKQHCPSVLEVGDGVFEVLSTSGDTHLGGDDFDKVCQIFFFSFFSRLYIGRIVSTDSILFFFYVVKVLI